MFFFESMFEMLFLLGPDEFMVNKTLMKPVKSLRYVLLYVHKLYEPVENR